MLREPKLGPVQTSYFTWPNLIPILVDLNSQMRHLIQTSKSDLQIMQSRRETKMVVWLACIRSRPYGIIDCACPVLCDV